MRVRLTLLITKLIRYILVKMGRGGSLPGTIALRLCPDILKHISYPEIIVMVTGTNGKTSTNNMMYEMLKKKYKKVISNLKGDNLKDGIVTLILSNTKFDLKCHCDAISIEVDELNTPKVLQDVPVSHFVIMNFFRDQLDRAGEMETIISKINNALPLFHGELILNGDDPNVARLGYKREKTYYFGMAKTEESTQTSEEAKEGKFCFHCQTPLKYEFYQYSHIGRYTCPSCDFGSHILDVEGYDVSLEKNEFKVDGFTFKSPKDTLYTMYNSLAVILMAKRLQVTNENVYDVLASFTLNKGRMERIDIGRECLVNLIKNPAGANETMKYIIRDKEDKDILIAINDNVPDGIDVSWIYDTNFELIFGDDVKNIVCTGLRAYEMALRIKYSSFKGNVYVEENYEDAIKLFKSLENHAYVMAVYTALQPILSILRR